MANPNDKAAATIGGVANVDLSAMTAELTRLREKLAEKERSGGDNVQVLTGDKGGILADLENIPVSSKSLVILVDLTKDLGLSSTGKAKMIASTRGFSRVHAPGTGEVTVSLNVSRKP